MQYIDFTHKKVVLEMKPMTFKRLWDVEQPVRYILTKGGVYMEEGSPILVGPAIFAEIPRLS